VSQSAADLRDQPLATLPDQVEAEVPGILVTRASAELPLTETFSIVSSWTWFRSDSRCEHRGIPVSPVSCLRWSGVSFEQSWCFTSPLMAG
jgi:hypothetical protein